MDCQGSPDCRDGGRIRGVRARGWGPGEGRERARGVATVVRVLKASRCRRIAAGGGPRCDAARGSARSGVVGAVLRTACKLRRTLMTSGWVTSPLGTAAAMAAAPGASHRGLRSAVAGRNGSRRRCRLGLCWVRPCRSLEGAERRFCSKSCWLIMHDFVRGRQRSPPREDSDRDAVLVG
jgi:hypothetical protein